MGSLYSKLQIRIQHEDEIFNCVAFNADLLERLSMVNDRWQTVKTTSDFQFFSSNP